MGRFTIRDEGKTIAMGLIKKIIEQNYANETVCVLVVAGAGTSTTILFSMLSIRAKTVLNQTRLDKKNNIG